MLFSIYRCKFCCTKLDNTLVRLHELKNIIRKSEDLLIDFFMGDRNG